MGIDIITGTLDSTACLGNVGPILGEVGPTYSYERVPWTGKI